MNCPFRSVSVRLHKDSGHEYKDGIHVEKTWIICGDILPQKHMLYIEGSPVCPC
jgi:hypothetical protein